MRESDLQLDYANQNENEFNVKVHGIKSPFRGNKNYNQI
jgi:hypothetical protein